MQHSLTTTFVPELGDPQKGKVREIYPYQDRLILIASDRISAFDAVLDGAIADKGKILTQLSLFWFERTKDIIENHLIFSPDPNVMVVKKCQVLPIEIIVRKYAAGSLWRDYQAGKAEKCGMLLPKSLKENQELLEPIVTPTTKSAHGHDVDISKDEIINKRIMDEALFSEVERIALALFKRGQDILDKCNMVLVDAKYEFGLDEEGKLILIDEIHTPDSSRFWFKDDVEKKVYDHYSKEFVREWLLKSGYKKNSKAPVLSQSFKEQIYARYLKVYQAITKEKLKSDTLKQRDRILERLINAKIIKGYFVSVYIDMDDSSESCEVIASILNDYKIPYKVVRGEIDKQALEDYITKYNCSIEPMVYVFSSTRNSSAFKEISKLCHWPCVINQPLDDSDKEPNVILNDPRSAAMTAIRKLKNICEVK